jgi:ABC-type Fe3+ transport system substrate-binding protein
VIAGSGCDRRRYRCAFHATHKDAANKYLSYLQSDSGQNSYAKFGFIKASKADLQIKEIP